MLLLLNTEYPSNMHWLYDSTKICSSFRLLKKDLIFKENCVILLWKYKEKSPLHKRVNIVNGFENDQKMSHFNFENANIFHENSLLFCKDVKWDFLIDFQPLCVFCGVAKAYTHHLYHLGRIHKSYDFSHRWSFFSRLMGK